MSSTTEGGTWLPIPCDRIQEWAQTGRPAAGKEELQKELQSKYINDYVNFCNFFDKNGVIIKSKAAIDIMKRTCDNNCSKIPRGYPSANFWTKFPERRAPDKVNDADAADAARGRAIFDDLPRAKQPDVCVYAGELYEDQLGAGRSRGDWVASSGIGGGQKANCCAGLCGCGATALLPGTKDNKASQPKLTSVKALKNPQMWKDPWTGDEAAGDSSGSHGLINILCTNCGEIGLHGGRNDAPGRKQFAVDFRKAMYGDSAESSTEADGSDGACFIQDNKQLDRTGAGRCSDQCGTVAPLNSGCGAGGLFVDVDGSAPLVGKLDGLNEDPDNPHSATMQCAQKLYPSEMYHNPKKYEKNNVDKKAKGYEVGESTGMLLQKFFAGGYPGGLDSMLLVVWGDLWIKDLMRWRPDCYESCPADDSPGDGAGDGGNYWRGWGESVDFDNMPNGDYGWFKRAGTRGWAGGNGSYKFTDNNAASESWLDCAGDGKSSRICQRNKGLHIKYGTDLFETITDTIMYIAPLAGLIAKQFRPDNTSQVMISLYSIIGAILQYAPSGNEYDQIMRPRFYGCPPQSNEARWAYNGCCSGAIFQFPSYNSNFGLCTEQFGGTETYRTQFEKQKKVKKSGWFNTWDKSKARPGPWSLVQFDPYKNMYTKNIFANKNIYIQTSVGPPSEWPGRDGKIKIIPSTRHNCDKVPLWVDCSTDYCLLANATSGGVGPTYSNSLKPTKDIGGDTEGGKRSCAKNCDEGTDESSETHGPPTTDFGIAKITLRKGNNTNINGYDTRYLSTIDAFNTYLGEAGGMCRWNSANNEAISLLGRVGVSALPGLTYDEGKKCGSRGGKIVGTDQYSLSQPQDNDDMCTPLNSKYRACPKIGMHTTDVGRPPPHNSIYGGCWENLCKKCPDWKEIGDFDDDYNSNGCPIFPGNCDNSSEYFSKKSASPNVRWRPTAKTARASGLLSSPAAPGILSKPNYDLICNIDEIQSSSEESGVNYGCPSDSKSPRHFDTCLQGMCGLGGQSDDVTSQFYYKNGVFLCDEAGRVEIPNFDGTPLEGLTPKDLKSSCVYGMPGDDSSEKLIPKVFASPSGHAVINEAMGRIELDENVLLPP